MNKAELLKEVSKETGIDLKTVRIIWNKATEIILSKLLYGLDVKISGFLNFELYIQNAREFMNPQTGKKERVPKRYKVRITFPRLFRDKLKEKKAY